MDYYPKGSEWRRWDLHIHTPGTQKNDQFEGQDPESKWDAFYDAINTYIGDGTDPLRSVVAVGITDYLSVDNYRKVISDKRLNNNVKLILPNVELRLVPIAQKAPVNIHCIFNPSIVDELEARFFGKLKFMYGNTDYTAARMELIRLGRDFKDDKSLGESEAYREGVNQFLIDSRSLASVFEKDKDLRENTIIVVSNNSKDGATGIVSHAQFFENAGVGQLEATRRQVYQMSDMIFSAQESDREYFLGKKADSATEVIRKCNSLKACIHGSDAHSCSKLFEPDGKRYCWIKADPSFSGLKQVIYEPETRVCISQIVPEVKPDYQVIDYVLIGDGRVQDEAIHFNDKLNCIIGGKSTGKSLLLHNIALAIDEKQVSEKSNLIGVNIDGRKLDDVKVFWRDGIPSGEKESEGRKIVYIPQTYLNRLSDEQEELTEIDEIIKDVILVSPEASEAAENMKVALLSQKSNVDRLIYETVNQYDVIQEKRRALSEIGSKKGIERELKKLNSQKNKLAKSSSVSDEDIVGFNDALSKEKKNSILIRRLAEDIEVLKSLESVVSRAQMIHRYEDSITAMISAAIGRVISISNKAWKEEKEKLIIEINDQITRLTDENAALEKIITSLKPKIDGNEAIKQLSETIQTEKEKLEKVSSIEQELIALDNNYNESVAALVGAFEEYRKIRKTYESIINNITGLNRDDLDFSVETPLRMDAFTDSLSTLLDARSLKNSKQIIDLETVDSTWMTSENISALIKNCLNGTIKLKNRKTPEQALREILSDWNNTTYQVKMDGDEISGMSPGKKALVLLKLLINLAESRCPILIDQPEDDLDNRSVFDELIPFIKDRKRQRQIIVVTHNANVVLGGDAEEIVVANQNGRNSPNEEKRFEYRSGAIEEYRAVSGKRGVLNSQGIQQHICDVLEGGEQAFDLRRNKYHTIKN